MYFSLGGMFTGQRLCLVLPFTETFPPLFLRPQSLVTPQATLTHHLGPEFILFLKFPPYFSFSS